ncbi:OTU-domain-containing protein [Xylaria nigripes]|nr:OTU-domain-containing protein [Xylaria nigripes]
METLEETQARHRKEQRDLQSRITSKKKNATKKTRKGVNDECTALERDLKERQAHELAALTGGDKDEGEGEGEGEGESATSEPVPVPEYGDQMARVADRLNDTSISSDTPASKQEPVPEPQNQAGKKRNRQRERLARRAAEQIAEAEAAEKEAAGMTDHRGLERTSLERAFSAHGLVEHEIRPDGHCLFSAVADQLAQREIPISTRGKRGDAEQQLPPPPYRLVRMVATEYMESHADDFAPFLEEPLDSYVPKIRDTAEWGGQLELLALASAYGVDIKVVQDGRTETIQPSGGAVGQEGERATIWLAYYRHGYGLGEHYNSLRKKS